MFGKVLVGFDGSAHAHRAIDAAVEIAGRFQAALTIAVVRPPESEEAAGALEMLYPLGDDATPLGIVLERAKARALAKGAASVESVVLRGNVVDVLIGFLERQHFDLAIVGSRGLSTGRRLLLGSVSSALVDRAPCPVMVVRPSRKGPARPGPKPTGGT
ncbi:MAG TPA: universal stress protein [Thermoplasmata archaeon]|nr:universal stress protein [Thermoplasmata archaeon]